MKKIIIFALFVILLVNAVSAQDDVPSAVNNIVDEYNSLTVDTGELSSQSYDSLEASSLDPALRSKSVFNKALGFKIIAELKRTSMKLPLNTLPSRPQIIKAGPLSESSRSPQDSGDRNLRIWPVSSQHQVITSCYGWRNLLRKNDWHDGIDFGIPVGTDVLAVNDGKVVETCTSENTNTVKAQKEKRTCRGYGIYAIVEHSDGTYSKYNHLNRLLVSDGDSVSKGQVIAESGNTGFSTGPHLHFSIFYSNDFTGDIGKDSFDRDPLKYLPVLDHYEFSHSKNCADSPTVKELNSAGSNIESKSLEESSKLSSELYIVVFSGINNHKKLHLIFKNDAWQWKVEGDSNYLSVNLPDNPELDFPWYSPTKNPDDNQRILLKSLKNIKSSYDGIDNIVDFIKDFYITYGSISLAKQEDDSIVKVYDNKKRNLDADSIVYDLSSASILGSSNGNINKVIDKSSELQVPPGLAIAVALQESGKTIEVIDSLDDDANAKLKSSDGGVGIFQITHESLKKKFGCYEDVDCNIRAGISHLKENYDLYYIGKNYVGCSSKTHDVKYSGWEAALRGYNGWPSGPSCAGDPDYVKNVKAKYLALPSNYKINDAEFGFSGFS